MSAARVSFTPNANIHLSPNHLLLVTILPYRRYYRILNEDCDVYLASTNTEKKKTTSIRLNGLPQPNSPAVQRRAWREVATPLGYPTFRRLRLTINPIPGGGLETVGHVTSHRTSQRNS